MRGGTDEKYASSLQRGGDVILHVHEHLADKYRPVDILIDRDGVWHMNGLPIIPGDLIHKVDVIWNTAHSQISAVLKSLGIPTPSRDFPYPPVSARRKPMGIDERLLEYTGREIKPAGLTYEALFELANKTDYLLKRQVEGLQRKMIEDEEKRKHQAAKTWERKYTS